MIPNKLWRPRFTTKQAAAPGIAAAMAEHRRSRPGPPAAPSVHPLNAPVAGCPIPFEHIRTTNLDVTFAGWSLGGQPLAQPPAGPPRGAAPKHAAEQEAGEAGWLGQFGRPFGE